MDKHTLKKLAANTVVAGGLGLAVIATTVGVAQATPATVIPTPNPVPSLPLLPIHLTVVVPSCSNAHEGYPFPGSATLAGFAAGTVRLFEDSLNGAELAPQQSNGPDAFTAQFVWPKDQTIPPKEETRQLWAQQSVGSQTLTAHCDIDLVYPYPG